MWVRAGVCMRALARVCFFIILISVVNGLWQIIYRLANIMKSKLSIMQEDNGTALISVNFLS